MAEISSKDLPLLPCPFCGSEDLTLQNLVDEDDYYVSCRKCEVQQIANYPMTVAIERWNQRQAGRNPMKMYVWTDRFSFLAVAHAGTVAEARKAMLVGMGESGDGSRPERDKARRCVLGEGPSIFLGLNAEFCLSDNAELREQEAYLRGVQDELSATKDALSKAVAEEKMLNHSEIRSTALVAAVCPHLSLNEDGICRTCGADCRARGV